MLELLNNFIRTRLTVKSRDSNTLLVLGLCHENHCLWLLAANPNSVPDQLNLLLSVGR